MKQKLISLLFFVVIAAGLQTMAAAPRHSKHNSEQWRKEMFEFKLKFLTQEMALREEQQKPFYTLYKQMTDEKDALMRSYRSASRAGRMENASEADYCAACDAMTKVREQELKIEKNYDNKFRKFLSSKQIFKMKEAERKFRDKMQKMRHNHHRKNSKK